ncbi:MAG: carbohydrate ABC transporter permease [Kiritimatiellaeota bacterium]|nr:carbohydrate ABC transporter permease [Kiritimatiellota bacterium]
MSNAPNKPLPWTTRIPVHIALAGGGLFFLLPLLWMIATSLKPLDQTMRPPTNLKTAFFGDGWQAVIGGRRLEVVREREIVPSESRPVYILRPLDPFPAGEMTHPFGKEVWDRYPVFNKQELARMNTRVTSAMTVLTDARNTFDPAVGLLTLQSGRKVRAAVVRRVRPASNGEKLWLVREWRPEDTDTKEVGAAAGDMTRAWDVLPESRLRKTIRLIPHNYPVALRRVHFARSLWNTLFLCAMVVCGTTISSLIVAYGFAFLQFRGRELLFGVTLATMMIPFPVVMIPIYLLYRDLGWVGSFKPLWVASWFGSAFFIFLLRQFYLGLPRDLLDAARIDGCSDLEILWYVVAPLSKPAIAMIALFTFLGTWKDFLGPLIYLNHESQFTLSLSLQAFASEHGGTPWHLLMAAATVFSLPLIILFFFAMKTFIRGVSMTGLKG